MDCGRSLIRAIDLVDYDDRPEAPRQRLGDDEFGLWHRPFGSVDQHQDAIDHAEDALDLAAEIGVTRSVNDVDPHVIPLGAPDNRGAFGEDRDAALAFQLVRIERPLGDLLIGAKGAALAQQLVDQRGLAVVDMRDDRDVADIHGILDAKRRRSAQSRPAALTSPDSAVSGRAPTWLMISAAHRLPIAPH